MPRLAGFNPRLALIVFSGTGARSHVMYPGNLIQGHLLLMLFLSHGINSSSMLFLLLV